MDPSEMEGGTEQINTLQAAQHAAEAAPLLQHRAGAAEGQGRSKLARANGGSQGTSGAPSSQKEQLWMSSGGFLRYSDTSNPSTPTHKRSQVFRSQARVWLYFHKGNNPFWKYFQLRGWKNILEIKLSACSLSGDKCQRPRTKAPKGAFSLRAVITRGGVCKHSSICGIS